jgi:menaquinone-dependent protoporphyrinogen oxidase
MISLERRGPIAIGDRAGRGKILVLGASKHEATWEIARRIGQELTDRGLSVTLVRLGQDTGPDLAGFDAVILGSAVYAGHWYKPARTYVRHHAAALSRRPLWLFSSGPLAGQDTDKSDAVRIDDIIAATGARDHAVFGGRLAMADLGAIERTVVRAVHATQGDNRDWAAVTAWAEGIAGEVSAAAGS